MAARTSSLNACRSSSRRSCQKPRLIIDHDGDDDQQVEGDPARRQQEPVHRGGDGTGAGLRYGRRGGAAGLPHPARREDRVDDRDRRVRRRAGAAGRRRATRRGPGTPTRSGSPTHAGFPDVVVFGLTPVAAARAARAGRRPPRGAAPRSRSTPSSSACSTTSCAAASPTSSSSEWGRLFATGAAWYRGEPFEMVQLIYPDRNGFLPYEPGFDQRMRLAQPVIGAL